ncbi:hypothetical protein C8J56DRAFT_1066065 [Mycena floridula]|nr:hypothetical protein C8J56DRAFT_1066065 [Mycena floridula]
MSRELIPGPRTDSDVFEYQNETHGSAASGPASESIISPHNVTSFSLHGASCGMECDLNVSAKRGEGFSSWKISPPSDDGGVFDSGIHAKADPSLKPPAKPKSAPKMKQKPVPVLKAPVSLLKKIMSLGPDRKTTAHQLATSIHPPDLDSSTSMFNAMRQIALLADKKKGLGPEATRVMGDLADWGLMWAKKEGELRKEVKPAAPQKESPLGERIGQIEKRLNEVLKGISNQQCLMFMMPVTPSLHHTRKQLLPPLQCSSKLCNMPNRELTAKIQGAVRGCNSESLNSVQVQAVSFKGRDHLKIFTKTEGEAQALLRFLEKWLVALAPGVTLITKVFKIVIQSVSSYHKPRSEDCRAEIIDKNPELTEENFIDNHWLNEKAIVSGKKASSLVISVALETAVNHIIEHGNNVTAARDGMAIDPTSALERQQSAPDALDPTKLALVPVRITASASRFVTAQLPQNVRSAKACKSAQETTSLSTNPAQYVRKLLKKLTSVAARAMSRCITAHEFRTILSNTHTNQKPKHRKINYDATLSSPVCYIHEHRLPSHTRMPEKHGSPFSFAKPLDLYRPDEGAK